MTPDELEAFAQRLYPSMAKPVATTLEPAAQPVPAESAPAADSQPAATTDQPAPADPPAYKLAPVPPEVMADRLRDDERRRYSAQGIYGQAIPHGMLDEVPDLPKEFKAEIVEEMREMARDLGASVKDVAEFRAIVNSITQAPTPEQRESWHEQTKARLNSEFGNQATRVLRDAHKFVSRDPRLVAMLNANQLGDHPDVVMKFARLAATARAKGKLK